MKVAFAAKKSVLFAIGAVTMTTTTMTTPAVAESICNTCDFNFLTPGVSLVNQAAALLENCNLIALPFGTYYNGNQQINVFNSEAVQNNNDKSDPDLATPHKSCPGFSTQGRGVGGKGEGGNYLVGTWPNCQGGQGNLLILQEVKSDGVTFDYSKPNDGWRGGCMFFAFVDIPKHSLDFGLLDIDEPETAKITVYQDRLASTAFESPSDIGNNGYWVVTQPNRNGVYADAEAINAMSNITALSICLPGSGALSFIHYCEDI